MVFFDRLNIRARLLVLVLMVLAGFTLLIGYTVASFNKVMVNGPVYRLIVQGKDIVADVLPPPKYIIESYLVALQMLHEEQPEDITKLIKDIDRLRGEYTTRDTFWQKDLAPDHPSRMSLLKDSQEPALRFYNILYQEYIPAIKEGRTSDAMELAYRGALHDEYEAHRRGVDEVVRTSTAENLRLEDMARSDIDAIMRAVALVSLAIALVVMGFCFAIARSITRPLRSLSHTIGQMTRGHGDLGKRLPEGHDETGMLAAGFNGFLDVFQEGLLTLSRIGKDIDGGTISMARRLVSNGKAALDSAGSSVEAIGLNTHEARAKLDGLRSSMDAMQEGQTAILKGVASQSSAMNDASRAMESLNKGIHGAASIADHFSKAADQLLHVSEASGKATGEIQLRVNGVQALSTSILQIIAVIDDIRDRTTILSMNASIEAAHAGQYGKGFAVVADEIRKLAVSTGQNLEAIQSSIAGIRQEIATTVTLSVQVNNQVEAAVSQAAQVQTQSGQLRQIMDGQVRETDRMASIFTTLLNNAEHIGKSSIAQDSLLKDAKTGLMDLSSAMDANARGVGEHQLQVEKLANEFGYMTEGLNHIRTDVEAMNRQLDHFGMTADVSGHD